MFCNTASVKYYERGGRSTFLLGRGNECIADLIISKANDGFKKGVTSCLTYGYVSRCLRSASVKSVKVSALGRTIVCTGGTVISRRRVGPRLCGVDYMLATIVFSLRRGMLRVYRINSAHLCRCQSKGLVGLSLSRSPIKRRRSTKLLSRRRTVRRPQQGVVAGCVNSELLR